MEKAIELYDYQVQPVSALQYALEHEGQALCVMATGLGKTIVSAFTIREWLLQGKRGLFLAHENYILSQAEEVFRKIVGGDLNYQRFYGAVKNWTADEADMLFASFQSMNNGGNKWYTVFDPNHFDFIIVDEGHHSQAETFRPVVEHFTAKKLALTGTPDREDQKDIRELFGSEVVDIPLEKGIANGWLADVEYHILSDGINNRKLKKILQRVLKKKERISVKQLNETIFVSERAKRQQQLIEEYNQIKDRALGKKTLIFCENIKHAEHTLGFFDNAAVVHSLRPQGENDEAMKKFHKGEIQYLISVDKLNEGIDFPFVELVAFLRATHSKRIFFQQLGRGARPDKDKLIVLDFVANVDRLLMIREMMQRVQEEVEANEDLKGKLSVRDFNVSGEGFEFVFSDELVDLLAVIDVLKNGFYETYEEASKAARDLGILKEAEYKRRYKDDMRLPSTPYKFYGKDWVSWPHFLRGEGFKDYYKTYEEASKAAKLLGVRLRSEYVSLYNLDSRLPSSPNKFYGKDWVSWPHFLRGEKPKDFHPSYKKASESVQNLQINTKEEYHSCFVKDLKLPRNPNEYYKDDWVSWPHFLRGENIVRRKFYSTYDEASKAARDLGIKGKVEYDKKYKTDPRLPSNPNVNYESDWVSWRVFLDSFYVTYKEASEAVQKLNIKSKRAYVKDYKKDPKLPSYPGGFYKDDWVSWPDFLGCSSYSTYEEASEAAKKLGVVSRREYLRKFRVDKRLRSDPYRLYSEDWIDWFHFLGTER